MERKEREHQQAHDAWVQGGRQGDQPELDRRYDRSRISWYSWRTYGDIYREEMQAQREDVAKKLFSRAVISENPLQYPEMEQIVRAMGFNIDREAGKPTASQILKDLQKSG